MPSSSDDQNVAKKVKKHSQKRAQQHDTSLAQAYITDSELEQELHSWSQEVIDMYLQKRKQYEQRFVAAPPEHALYSTDDPSAALRLFLQREYDKLKRINSTINKGKGEGKDAEVIEDALRDIVGYVYVIRSYLLSRKAEQQSNPE